MSMTQTKVPPDDDPHRQVLLAFAKTWSKELSTDEAGKMLTSLSMKLGEVIAELTARGIPWEIIDRNIHKSVRKGVDQHLKVGDPSAREYPPQ